MKPLLIALFIVNIFSVAPTENDDHAEKLQWLVSISWQQTGLQISPSYKIENHSITDLFSLKSKAEQEVLWLFNENGSFVKSNQNENLKSIETFNLAANPYEEFTFGKWELDKKYKHLQIKSLDDTDEIKYHIEHLDASIMILKVKQSIHGEIYHLTYTFKPSLEKTINW